MAYTPIIPIKIAQNKVLRIMYVFMHLEYTFTFSLMAVQYPNPQAGYQINVKEDTKYFSCAQTAYTSQRIE